MRRITISKTGTGSSALAPMDQYQSPFNVGIGVVVSGTVSYTVQHTFDDVQNPLVTPVWFNHPTLASLATNSDGNYAFPVSAIKVLINSGTGSATATILQAGVQG